MVRIQTTASFDADGKFAGIWVGYHIGDDVTWEWRPNLVGN